MEEKQPVEEQQPRPTIYQSPMNQYGSSILTLTNPEDELYKMELSFKGIILDKEGNPQKKGYPLMNEKGITSVIGQVQIIFNRVTIMSNFTKYDVPILLNFLGDSLAKDLMMNRKNYEINSTADRDKIYFAVLSSSSICLKRGFEEGDRWFWKGSTQEITTTVVGGQQKQGMLSSLMGWGK